MVYYIVSGLLLMFFWCPCMLAEEFYATDVDGVPGSWCLQSHVREGIFRDADMSRDDDFQES